MYTKGQRHLNHAVVNNAQSDKAEIFSTKKIETQLDNFESFKTHGSHHIELGEPRYAPLPVSEHKDTSTNGVNDPCDDHVVSIR